MKNPDYNQDFLGEQKRFLQDMIAFQQPIEELEKRDKIGPAWEDRPDDLYLATLTRHDVILILKRFIDDDLSAEELNDWADFFSFREDVTEEKGFGQAIMDVIGEIEMEYDFGNPISKNRAEEIILQLQSAKHDPEDI